MQPAASLQRLRPSSSQRVAWHARRGARGSGEVRTLTAARSAPLRGTMSELDVEMLRERSNEERLRRQALEAATSRERALAAAIDEELRAAHTMVEQQSPQRRAGGQYGDSSAANVTGRSPPPRRVAGGRAPASSPYTSATLLHTRPATAPPGSGLTLEPEPEPEDGGGGGGPPSSAGAAGAPGEGLPPVRPWSAGSAFGEEGGGAGGENIIVVCRVRPSSVGERAALEAAEERGSPPLLQYDETGRSITLAGAHSFRFRRVFQPHVGQDQLYDAVAAPMVVSRPFPSWNRSILTEIYLCHACSRQEILRTETAGQDAVLDGFNAAMICYGQTGAGKSYTMLGDERQAAPPEAAGECGQRQPPALAADPAKPWRFLAHGRI
jgi:hypothetical protein